MSVETIEYLLAKYYGILTSTQYLLQEELKEPSTYTADEDGYLIEPKLKYKVEIDMLKRLIKNLEDLKNELEYFGF